MTSIIYHFYEIYQIDNQAFGNGYPDVVRLQGTVTKAIDHVDGAPKHGR